MNRFDRNSLEDSIANSLTNVINIMGFNPEAVAERLKFQHRALQEDFTRICMEWLKVVASPDYSYDARNEYSHKAAQEMLHPEKWAVITIYSFDADTTIKYFDTEYEAKNYLEEDFRRECDIATNENNKTIQSFFDYHFGYATLKTPSTIADNKIDIMEWRVVKINI